ncbi:hypothetical protein [Pandoraea iniqua]|uniref:hypothetical protein n=1 Tax=Pandoraea iniqua TaxID=2508288 RepID=UPI001240C576
MRWCHPPSARRRGGRGRCKISTLRILDVSGNRFGDKGCKALLAMSDHLKSLSISFNQLGDDGVVALA